MQLFDLDSLSTPVGLSRQGYTLRQECLTPILTYKLSLLDLVASPPRNFGEVFCTHPDHCHRKKNPRHYVGDALTAVSLGHASKSVNLFPSRIPAQSVQRPALLQAINRSGTGKHLVLV